MSISLSEIYIIKGIILEVSVDALQYFSYNTIIVLILHSTLQYLHRADLSGELSYACFQYCFGVIWTKWKTLLASAGEKFQLFGLEALKALSEKAPSISGNTQVENNTHIKKE